MKIEIEHGCAIGLLKFNQNDQISDADLFQIESILPNFFISIWYDIEQDIVLVKMKGSIISMMQFRKYIMLYCPNALDERED